VYNFSSGGIDEVENEVFALLSHKTEEVGVDVLVDYVDIGEGCGLVVLAPVLLSDDGVNLL